MSAFTAHEVRHLAALAQLELGPEETEAFARQLSEILEFARQVQAVDTSLLAGEDAIVLAAEAPRRDDVLEPSLRRDDVLSGAPDADRTTGLFKVPRVLNG